MNSPRFAMVSQWMPKGSIREYTEAHASVGRLELVRLHLSSLFYLPLTANRCVMDIVEWCN